MEKSYVEKVGIVTGKKSQLNSMRYLELDFRNFLRVFSVIIIARSIIYLVRTHFYAISRRYGYLEFSSIISPQLQ